MSDTHLQKSIEKILFAIASEDLSKIDLACPRCGEAQLVYSFAVNRPPKYGLYISCGNCHLLSHLTLGSKPPNFREDLVLPYYQELENQAIRFADSFIDDKKNSIS